MSYELFRETAIINSSFETIPSKTSLLAEGAMIDKNGSLQYKGKTYTIGSIKTIKLADLPEKLQPLFIEQKNQLSISTAGNITTADDDQKDGLGSLNKILFDQLQNIANPVEGTDMQQELKKANAVCNVADKIISITDLSLKAEIFMHKKKKGYW
jgi:hypothetical protein